MKRAFCFALVLIAGVALRPTPAYAQAAARPTLRPGTPYPQIRTHYEQAMRVGLSKDQKLDLLREIVKAGRHSGDRRLQRMFKNFEGGYQIDLDTPGFLATGLQTASTNRVVVQGHARTIVYAQGFQRSGQFRLEALNQLTKTPLGKTDLDLVLRHKATGTGLRVEVKSMRPASQRTNLPDIYRQIDKMAWDAQRHGRLQAWVNSGEVIPQIKDYAARHGVAVYEHAHTGKAGRLPGRLAMDDVIAREGQRCYQSRAVRTAGLLRLGGSVFMLAQGSSALLDDLRSLRHAEGEGLATMAQFGRDGSLVLAGGSLTVAGLADISRLTKLGEGSTKLRAVSRWGNRLGMTATLATGGIMFYQYHAGELSQRQLYTEGVGLGAGFGTGLAAGWALGKAGVWVGGAIGFGLGGPPGAALGATIGGLLGGVGGGVGGGYLGSSLASGQTAAYFELKDRRQQEKYQEFLYAHYGLK
jgi:hypothetical protein